MSIPSLKKEQLYLDKAKSRLKNIPGAIEWYEREVGHYHNLKLSKQRTQAPKGVCDLSGFRFPSDSQIDSTSKEDERLLRTLKRINEQFPNAGNFNAQDFTWSAFTHSPGFILKQGGTYNPKGYPVYDWFYVPQGDKFEKVKPKGDADGFYFMYNGTPTYYYRFGDHEPEPEPTPAKPKKASTKPKTPKPKTPKTTSSSKQLLGPKGHGLSRLLAEAKDPPIIEFRGPLNKLKAFKRGVLRRYTVLGSSSTYHWGKAHGDKVVHFMLSFDSVCKREEFIASCKLTLPEYRLGNLAGWG